MVFVAAHGTPTQNTRSIIMPRPPLLPTIDWQAVHASGKSWEDWLAAAEFPEHRTRMEETERGLALDPDAEGFLKSLARPVHVVAIAEDWCGDVVRHAPALARVAAVSPKVRLRFIGRADWPDVFARFLTNGGEAIPKFIFLSEQFVETGHWGPMPDLCREYIARGKACGDVGAARQIVGRAYEADGGLSVVVRELVGRIDVAASGSPDPWASAWVRRRG
jgi:hypothetical protein